MKKLITGMFLLLALAATLGFSAPASAGGYYGHHRGGHHGYRNHYYGYRHGHRYSRHHDYGYLAAGLVLGAAFSNYDNRPRYVERRTVIYRTPIISQPTIYTPARRPAQQGQPAPAERPDYYLRKDRDGECWLVETTEEGEQIITPQSPDVCG